MESHQEKRTKSLLLVLLILAFILASLLGCAGIVLLRSPLSQRSDAVTNPASTRAACGQAGTIRMLLIGTETVDGLTSADVIHVILINFDSPRITTIAFPRNLWVKTPQLSSLNISEASLGPAYSLIQQSASGTPQEKSLAGSAVIAQALYDNFAIDGQRYVTVDLVSFSKMIDAISGVEVNLPADIKMRNGALIPAGKQILDGPLSKEYILTLDGETAGFQPQNLYAQALRNKVMSIQTLPNLPKLLPLLKEGITTDLTPRQLLSIACAVDKTPPDQVFFYTVNGDLVNPQVDGRLMPHYEKIITNLNLWLGQ